MSGNQRFCKKEDYPCLGCEKRYVKIVDGKPVRCHSTCADYLEAKAKRDAKNEAIKKKGMEELEYIRYHKKNVQRIREGRRHD